MDNSRCVILVPAGRHIEPHCQYSLRQLEAEGYPVRRLHGFAQIDVARNRLASEAVAEGFEELMWIDSDIAFEPRSVRRLRSHDLPIVCGLYPKKVEKAWSCQFLPGQRALMLGEGGGLIEILYAAAGFLLVRRSVFLEIQERLAGLHNATGKGVRQQRRTSYPWWCPVATFTSISARISRFPNVPGRADFKSSLILRSGSSISAFTATAGGCW